MAEDAFITKIHTTATRKLFLEWTESVLEELNTYLPEDYINVQLPFFIGPTFQMYLFKFNIDYKYACGEETYDNFAPMIKVAVLSDLLTNHIDLIPIVFSDDIEPLNSNTNEVFTQYL